MTSKNAYWCSLRLLVLIAVALAVRKAWTAELDIPVVHILASDPCAAETGQDTATFTVARTGPTNAIYLEQPIVSPPPYIVCWPSFAFGHIEDNDFAPTNQPPSVRLVNPPDGSVFIGPVDLRLVAQAVDVDGRVVSVEFFDGTNSIAVFQEPPYSFVWSNVVSYGK